MTMSIQDAIHLIYPCGKAHIIDECVNVGGAQIEEWEQSLEKVTKLINLQPQTRIISLKTTTS